MFCVIFIDDDGALYYLTAGLTFEMYVQEQLTDTQLEILSGQIELSLENGSAYQLKQHRPISV